MAKPMLRTLVLVALAGLLAGAPSLHAGQPQATVRKFTLVSVQFGDTRMWLPGTIVVHQGDKVELLLKNEIPGEKSEHGFSLPAYGITEIVRHGDLKAVEFVASKPGIFNYFCQLHPAHVGGQLIVEPDE
jgi:nitrosocyanin